MTSCETTGDEHLRLKAEFVYLAVILDAYSRKLAGWALEHTLAARLAMVPLKHVVVERYRPPGLLNAPGYAYIKPQMSSLDI